MRIAATKSGRGRAYVGDSLPRELLDEAACAASRASIKEDVKNTGRLGVMAVHAETVAQLEEEEELEPRRNVVAKGRNIRFADRPCTRGWQRHDEGRDSWRTVMIVSAGAFSTSVFKSHLNSPLHV